MFVLRLKGHLSDYCYIWCTDELISRYGEIVDINLVRDKSSGKFKGYGFLCYEDQRSTILAVDNLNGIKVDKVYAYRLKCHMGKVYPV